MLDKRDLFKKNHNILHTWVFGRKIPSLAFPVVSLDHQWYTHFRHLIFLINILSLNLSKLIKVVSQKLNDKRIFVIISSGLIWFVWLCFKRVSRYIFLILDLILWWFSVKWEKVGRKHGVVIIKWWLKNQIHKQ